MKEGRKPEYPEKTPGDELHAHAQHVSVSVGHRLVGRTV